MSHDTEFKELLAAIAQVEFPDQTFSQALLYWFLFNVFRLDEIESRDTVCDKPNDKGIDGVWADEDSQEVFLFQSRYTEKVQKGLGDTDLKEFVGSAAWFANPENIRSLMTSNANQELKSVVGRLALEKKIEEGYLVRLVFVTTKVLDGNGREYLDVLPKSGTNLEVWDRTRLVGHYRNLQRKTRVRGTHRFTSVRQKFNYEAQHGVRVLVAPVRAIDIAGMGGIEDRSLFSLNVRSGLGRTRVNRDLEQAIKETRKHDQFVLFHNGVTIICRKLSARGGTIAVTDYSVANGCQSAIAFHDNRSALTDQLRVVARIIEVGDDDALAEDITFRSNNQNGINLRDLKSNDRIQIALRREFQDRFRGKVEFVIKAGEEHGAEEVIKNDRAGQWLMSVYLGEPFNAHQKYKLFGSDYERIFGRNVTAETVYLCFLISRAIDSAIDKVKDESVRGYQLTTLILMGVIADRLKVDRVGRDLLARPQLFIPQRKDAIIAALAKFAALLVPDFNYWIDEKTREANGYFDYKSGFKSGEEYLALSRALLRDYEKSIVKRPDESFESILGSQ